MINVGDKISFLDYEHGMREGVGGLPGVRECIFSRRRRYTGIVTELSGPDKIVVSPDPGQSFTNSNDGIVTRDDGTKEIIVSQSSVKKK